jgi:lysophospholipase L1-like esterase
MGVEAMGRRRRSWKRKLFYAAIPTILAFIMIEGLFRLYALVEQRYSARREYDRLLRDPAFHSKPWFSPAFLAATITRSRSRFYVPAGTHLKLASDYRDQFFNIRDGIRNTVGFDPSRVPPNQRSRRLFVIGGSTTFCGNVPDEYTYASQLQTLLAATPQTSDVEVVNCGAGGAVSFEEVERLEYEIERGNVPDFCVFFDGINDAIQGVVNGLPGGTIFEAELNYGNSGLLPVLKRIAKLSIAARTICLSVVSSQRQNDPTHAQSPAKVRELAVASADAYEQNVLRAKEVCDRYQISMMVLLQPNLYSIGGRPWSSHERAVAERMRKSHGDAIRAAYPLFREKLSRLRERGVLVQDISDAFDRNTEPIFDDDFHVESTGNRLIAEAILKQVLPVLKRSSVTVGAPPGVAATEALR